MSTEVTKSFSVDSWSVLSLYQRPGAGFYIPVYQRKYSWDRSNIETLLSDICEGVQTLCDDANSLSFLGTLILLPDPRKAHVSPKEPRAIPSEVSIVIDGQQRLTTLAAIGCALHLKLGELSAALPKSDPYQQLEECIDSVRSSLHELWTLDLKRGSPPRKPKIIRAQQDQWTYDGEDGDNYRSDIASFLAKQIRATVDGQAAKLSKDSDNLVVTNFGVIRKLLTELALTGRVEVEDEVELTLPDGSKLSTAPMQQEIWDFERTDLTSILQTDSKGDQTPGGVVCAIARLLAFTNYLLRRCCMTVIQPDSERWAFDMFQSLNATGSPLTALETFKPLVVRSEKTFAHSESERNFNRIESLYDHLKTASEKTSATNELLRAFALAYDGTKLSNRFSFQRSWLERKYGALSTNDQRGFLREMAHIADYGRLVWEKPDALTFANTGDAAAAVAKSPEGPLAALCVAYLSAANHKITHAPLGRFFSAVIDGVAGNAADLPARASEFTGATKVLAAFYTLWRAAGSNSGLDKVYRDAMAKSLSMTKHPTLLSAKKLATPLVAAIGLRGLDDKKKWLAAAENYLRYSSAKAVCKFCLLVAADDTIPDPSFPGLVKPGMPGAALYLSHPVWVSDALADIEHVAPQSPPANSTWDPALYENDMVNSLGNLTLLPRKVNSSVSNRRWGEKSLYYQHLGQTDPQVIAALKQAAASAGYQLDAGAVKILNNSKHAAHLKSIAALPSSFAWDEAFVRRRAACLLGLVWDRLYPWLFV